MLLSLILFILLSTTACVKYDSNISIDKKGNVEIVDTVSIAKYAYEIAKGEIDLFCSKINNDQNLNENAEKYLEYDSIKVKITQNIEDVARKDINTENLYLLKYFRSQNGSKKIINVKKFFFFTVYDINGIINQPGFPLGEGYLNSELFYPKISIKIPTQAKKSNADNQDIINNIYSWEIKDSVDCPIILSYYILNTINIVIFTILTTILIIGIIVISRLNKQNIITNNTKFCLFCGQSIKKQAKKCRYCGNWLK